MKFTIGVNKHESDQIPSPTQKCLKPLRTGNFWRFLI